MSLFKESKDDSLSDETLTETLVREDNEGYEETASVKGEIDINGPVVVDSKAIIKGNINAKSVQINNGAVIDGFCSLSYSDINIEGIFE